MRKLIPLNAKLIPDNATRVFEGILYDVYQWPQKLTDGTTATFEMLKRVDTALVVAVQGGKLLLAEVRQPGGVLRTYTLPGGRADKGTSCHSMLEVAQKEMREETGLEFKNWRLIHVRQQAEKIEGFFYLYLATDLLAERAVLDEPGEQVTLRPTEFAEAKRIAADGYKLDVLNDVIKRLDSLEELLDLPEFRGREVDR